MNKTKSPENSGLLFYNKVKQKFDCIKIFSKPKRSLVNSRLLLIKQGMRESNSTRKYLRMSINALFTRKNDH